MPPEDHPQSSTSGRESNQFGAFPLMTPAIAAEKATLQIGSNAAPGASAGQDAAFHRGMPA
jgi:hypothetical protein